MINLASLKVNPDWASLPLFDRTGWRRLPFGAFAESVNDRVEPRDAAEETYVGLEHLDSGSLHIRRSGKGSDVIGTKLRFRKGDIIFGRRRAYQRKLAIAETNGICSAHAMVVRAKPDLVLPEFLPFLMMSDKFMNRAVEISVGSLSPTINWKTLKVEEFDLPPLDQQRRMAEILWALDEVLCRHEALRVSVKDGLLTERDHFFTKARLGKTLSVEQLFEVQLGKMLSPKAKRGTSPLPYLGNKNVQWGTFDLRDIQVMDFSDREFEKFKLLPGDLLVCEGGEVGRSAVWQGQIEGCCFQKAIHRLRPLDGTMTTKYMLEFMMWGGNRGLFSGITGHSTIAHLTAIKLKALKVPLVSSSEQRSFLARISAFKDALQIIEDRLRQTLSLRAAFLKLVE